MNRCAAAATTFSRVWGAASSLDQPQVGGDLVGSVHSQVQPVEDIERLYVEARLPGKPLALGGGRHATDLEVSPCQGRDEMSTDSIRDRGRNSPATRGAGFGAD